MEHFATGARLRTGGRIALFAAAALASGCFATHVDHARRAERAALAGDWRAAARDYDRAIAENAGVAAYYAGLGRALNELGRYDEAEPALRRAVGFRPYEANWHWWLGLSLAGQEKWQRAIGELGVALEYAPGDQRIRTDLGMVHLYRGELDEAARTLGAVLRVSPRQAEAAFGLGLVALRAADPGAAAERFAEAEALGGPDLVAYAAILGAWARADRPKPPPPAPPPPEISLPEESVEASAGAPPAEIQRTPARTRASSDPEALLGASPWVPPARSGELASANPWKSERGLPPAPPAEPTAPAPPPAAEPRHEATVGTAEPPAPAEPAPASRDLAYYCDATPAGTAREIVCFVGGRTAEPRLAADALPREEARFGYFVGMHARRGGDDWTARRYFRMALETQVRNDWAWRAAAWALDQP